METILPNYRFHIGIDPGKTGAIAVLDTVKDTCKTFALSLYTLSNTIKEVDSACKAYPRQHEKARIIIEDVHAFPDETPVSAFALGHSAGEINGVVETHYFNEYHATLESTYVKAQIWQGFCFIGMSRSEYRTKEMATRFVEKELNITGKNRYPLYSHDAICLALYSKLGGVKDGS